MPGRKWRHLFSDRPRAPLLLLRKNGPPPPSPAEGGGRHRGRAVRGSCDGGFSPPSVRAFRAWPVHATSTFAGVGFRFRLKIACPAELLLTPWTQFCIPPLPLAPFIYFYHVMRAPSTAPSSEEFRAAVWIIKGEKPYKI